MSVGALLEEFPSSRVVAPLAIAGTLIALTYRVPQELEADRREVTILRYAGYSREVTVRALAWIMKAQGNSSEGFYPRIRRRTSP